MNTREFTVLAVSAFVFGVVLGCYLGTILYRLKVNAPFLTRKCFCPACKHTLLLRDQIPVIGYVMLRGRCRYCGAKISPAYPLREVLVGVYYFATFMATYKSPVLMLILWLAMPFTAFMYVAVRYKVNVVKAYLNLLLMTLPYTLLVFALCQV